MELGEVWVRCTWGFTIGIGIGFFAYFMGVWSGVWLRWAQEMFRG